MLGEAKTNEFMLGTATVMLGAQSELMDLNPTDHSIGLVKNFSVTAEPQFTELRQGVRNQMVYSKLTENSVRCSMEVYEYTASNLAYALQLNGQDFAPKTVTSNLDAAIDGTSTPVSDIDVTASDGANFTAGDHIMIDAGNDLIITREVSSVAVDTLTVTPDIKIAIPANAEIKVVNVMDMGHDNEDSYYALKAVGRAANNEPMVILMPKVRITNGFSVNFQTDDYGNLPFEASCYDLVASDPNYARFKNKQAELLRA